MKPSKLFSLSALTFATCLLHLQAQDDPKTSCTSRNEEIVKQAASQSKDFADESKKSNSIRIIYNLLLDAGYVVACGIPNSGLVGLSASEFESFAARAIDEAQVDKQVGANGGTGGSTSLVSNGLAPSLVGFAFESGGLEREITGTVVTLRANPTKLISSLAKKYGPGLEPPKDKFWTAISKVNVAATFDTKRTASADSSATSPFLANYQQLTEFSARVTLFDDRDPYSHKNWLAFSRLRETPEAIRMTNAAIDFQLPLVKNPIFRESVSNLINKLLSPIGAESRKTLLLDFNKFLQNEVKSIADNKDVAESIRSFVKDAATIAESRRKLVKDISSQALFNFEYALVRPPLVTSDDTSTNKNVKTSILPSAATTQTSLNLNPDISAARLIGTWKVGTTDVSWNSAATFFNTLRPGMSGHFRDFNTGISAATPIGTLPSIGKVTSTISTRYMYLHQKPLGVNVLFNSTKINKPGNIFWINGKLTFPGPVKSVKIPVSVTYSNRTELIDEKDIRVNFGFTISF